MPDRMPVSFWRHFYDQESSAEDLARAMLDFQRKYDWDLMKINPRASYHLEDWGNRYEYTGKPEDKPIRKKYAVHGGGDWGRIKYLDPNQAEVLKEHIKSIRLIKDEAPDDLPIVMTVFNPLSIAGDLVEKDDFLVDQIRNNPDPVHMALQNITKTFIDFCLEAVDSGVDGIFFATTQWASTNLLKEREYEEFGKKYDLMLLDQVLPKTKLNILHVCSSNNMLPVFADYPIDIVNWDMNDDTNPDVMKGAEVLEDKVVMGGVERKGLLQNGTPDSLGAMVDNYYNFGRDNKFFLGPDCSIPVSTPDKNLEIIKTKVEQLKYS